MPPSRCLRAACTALFVLAFAAPAVAVTANGRLQVIHLDVGQGDGAVIISPLGQVAMIDNGVSGNPTPANGTKVAAQLQALGVTHVDHHFASHYHADHIGLFGPIFGAGGIATLGYGWDRGGSYTTGTYTTYVNTLGNRRRTLAKNQVITLDSLSAHPVTITCIDLNGAGVSTTDENSLSLMLKVSYGEFDETFGGDLPYSGINPESRIAAEVGTAEVYKAHHHGSATSGSDVLLAAISPKVAVVSCGTGNSYGHPTAAALSRMHARNVRTYWTELGAGVAPLAGWDTVSNDQVVISATWEPGGVDTIRGNGFADTFTNSGTPLPDALPPVANLTAPDGGEEWKVGSSHALTWTASDNVGVASVDLSWSADGGLSWSPIASGLENSGTYGWVVPASATSTGRVKVAARDAAGNLGADSSLAVFSIDWWTIVAGAGPGGTITPSGTVDVAEGANRSFTIAPGAGFEVADLVVDGTPAGALAAYQFTAVSAHHTIAASFLDVAEPAVTVTSPVGGEIWSQGSPHDITWTASDNLAVDSVSVEYSAHGPSGPWVPVAHGLPNTGSYAWTVPALGTDSALVRVTAWDPALHAGAGTSPGLFQLGRGTTAAGDAPPAATLLYAPFPNPIAGRATVRFDVARAGDVTLEVFDLSGRRASMLLKGGLEPGRYSVQWNGLGEDGAPVRAGLYFVRLTAPGAGAQSARVTVVH